MPAAIVLGTSTFTMSALPGTPSIQNAIPMPFFGTTPFAAPGLGVIAALIMLGFGLWWLSRAEQAARRRGEGFGAETSAQPDAATNDERLRVRATAAREFDPAEIHRGHRSDTVPPALVAALPLCVVVAVNLTMSLLVLPRLDSSFLAEERFGDTSITAVAGVWSVVVAVAAAILVVVVCNRRRLPALRQSVDAGGLLVSLAVATNVLAALTGSASGGLTIALDALGATYMKIAAETGLSPALMHRVAVIGSGTLDLLPHNGAVVSLLAICGVLHRQGYADIVMVGIVSAMIALVAVIVLGSAFRSF
jgi:H+/gluconate symporter-like permease